MTNNMSEIIQLVQQKKIKTKTEKTNAFTKLQKP